MVPPTDGRPEEEFLRKARRRIEAREAQETADDEVPIVDAVVDFDDFDADEHTLAETDSRVPPWWRVRRHGAWSARGIILAVLLAVAFSLVLIGVWTLASGELPATIEMQPSPHALPGEEDYGEPFRRRPF